MKCTLHVCTGIDLPTGEFLRTILIRSYVCTHCANLCALYTERDLNNLSCIRAFKTNLFLPSVWITDIKEQREAETTSGGQKERVGSIQDREARTSKSHPVWIRRTRPQLLASPRTYCSGWVTWGMASLSLSFSTVKWDERIYFTEVWQGLDEVIPIECPANLMRLYDFCLCMCVFVFSCPLYSPSRGLLMLFLSWMFFLHLLQDPFALFTPV